MAIVPSLGFYELEYRSSDILALLENALAHFQTAC
jgi:hypothetical protein